MDLISACERAVTPVRLNAIELVSMSPNATVVGLSSVSVATTALVLLVCVLLGVWSHMEKSSVPGERFPSALSLSAATDFVLFLLDHCMHCHPPPQVRLSAWVWDLSSHI